MRPPSLTKTSSSTLASFLGDPAFPKVALESSRGGKILLYQDLYKRYSRLKLSHQVDRPIAIAGLEKRLIHSFKVHGGFGVLDDDKPGLLRRSLLWCRGEDKFLERIDFGANQQQHVAHEVPPPPSWSWMAYRGAIEYLSPPFNEVEWESEDILSPWANAEAGTWMYSGDSRQQRTGLSVNVRAFKAAEAATRADSKLIFDSEVDSSGSGPSLKCVIMGRMKGSHQNGQSRIHYIMLVRPTCFGKYERIGVGYLPGDLIELHASLGYVY